MKVTCKKDFRHEAHHWFVKGKIYFIRDEDILTDEYWIKVDNMGYTLYQKFVTKELQNMFPNNVCFDDYFYTEQEVRKIKLENINKL